MLSEKTGSKTQLSPNSPEFAYLEYGLQLSLNSSTARITSAFTVSNPHQTLQFEKQCKDMLILPSYVESNQLVGGNTEDDVIRRGFRWTLPDKGGQFSTGSLDINDGASRIHKVLVCKLGVGRAYSVDADEIHKGIPIGYNSLYIRDVSTISDRVTPQDYHHVYYIENPCQILPQYLIHYDFDPNKEIKSREIAFCENCEEEPATVYCSADMANLCGTCDQELHSSKLAMKHSRTPIGKGANDFGNCRHHPDKFIEFFCSQCHIPVCVFCKMVGNHANGESSRHQLVSVSEAYQSVLLESKSMDPILHIRKTEIDSQIKAIQSRAQAVQGLRQTIESQIEEVYKKAMSDLSKITEKKMNVLLGDELELSRQYGEIERLEKFLKYQEDGDATSFLFNWSRHQMFRAELHDFSFFNREIDVQLDAKLVGSISVVTEDDEPPIRNHSPSKLNSKRNSPSKLQNSISIGNKLMTQDHRRVNRKTSDLFAETLGALDSSSINDDDIDSYCSFRDE